MGLMRAGKAALKEDRRRLGHDDDAFADLAAEEVGGRGLAAAGTAGEDDATSGVR
jgi:hypothetical protein